MGIFLTKLIILWALGVPLTVIISSTHSSAAVTIAAGFRYGLCLCSRPPESGRGAPVVVGSVSGKPRTERTAR
jgi:hypothetical protein